MGELTQPAIGTRGGELGIVGGWRVGRERISGSAAKGGWTVLLFQEIVVSNEDSYDQSLDSKSKQQIQRLKIEKGILVESYIISPKEKKDLYPDEKIHSSWKVSHAIRILDTLPRRIGIMFVPKKLIVIII